MILSAEFSILERASWKGDFAVLFLIASLVAAVSSAGGARDDAHCGGGTGGRGLLYNSPPPFPHTGFPKARSAAATAARPPL